ncbi:hypothetical protein WR25_00881 isoform A [Diploscapter pachys]|uniref:Uncharacterized protein n=2 Tax=Diploscapter pachys TaxID=2018661 RepID=A0A2A2KVJ0_9BILA|nr:hypothetical protein WR25_00881 isoform A [Diploscapter pachys]
MSQPPAALASPSETSFLHRICFCCYANANKEPPVQLIRSGSIKPVDLGAARNGHISSAQRTIGDLEESQSGSEVKSSNEPVAAQHQVTENASTDNRSDKRQGKKEDFRLNDIMLDEICAEDKTEEHEHKVEDAVSISTDVVEAVDENELEQIDAKPNAQKEENKEGAQKLTMQEFLEEERIRGSEGTQSSLTQSKVETSRAADDAEHKPHAPALILNRKDDENEEEESSSEDEIMLNDLAADSPPAHSPPAIPPDQSPARSPRHSTPSPRQTQPTNPAESESESTSPPPQQTAPTVEISTAKIQMSRMYGAESEDDSDDERSSTSDGPGDRQRIASGNSPRLQKMKPINFPPNSADSSIGSSDDETDKVIGGRGQLNEEKIEKTESEKENQTEQTETKGPMTRISVKSNGAAEIHSYVSSELDSQREGITDDEFPEKLI